MNSKKLGTQKFTDMICDSLNELPAIVAEDVIAQMLHRVPAIREAFEKESDNAEKEELKALTRRLRDLADEADSIAYGFEEVHLG